MVRIVGFLCSFCADNPFRIVRTTPFNCHYLWYADCKKKKYKPGTGKRIAAHQVMWRTQENPIEWIDRITVKDGSRIHLVKADEMIYIQACGDYVMLITPTGEYLKEQTMKYFETHLSPDTFVRVHRSTIVNVTQISRVELFGKETYQLLLKNGVKLRVSLSGYRLLKERLGI